MACFRKMGCVQVAAMRSFAAIAALSEALCAENIGTIAGMLAASNASLAEEPLVREALSAAQKLADCYPGLCEEICRHLAALCTSAGATNNVMCSSKPH